MSKKLTNPQKCKQLPLVNNHLNNPKHISISLKYLAVSKNDLMCLHNSTKRDPQRGLFKEFENFIHDAENFKEIRDLVSLYGSHNGRNKKQNNTNNFVKSIKKQFEESEFKNELSIQISDIQHLHCKRNGKGKFLIYGIIYETTFYILAFDPEHNSI